MEVFRICKTKYASDLSGIGAKTYGGRWNKIGTSMLYCSSHISLCALELACNSGGLVSLTDLQLICLSIKEPTSILKPAKEELPEEWNQYPSTIYTQYYGSKWIESFESLVLKVPSAVVAEEYNYLLNPLHPQFHKQVRVLWTKPFTFDPRLFQ